jgi:hypothetical protein
VEIQRCIVQIVFVAKVSHKLVSVKIGCVAGNKAITPKPIFVVIIKLQRNLNQTTIGAVVERHLIQIMKHVAT